MSVIVTMVGEAFDDAPAFTIKCGGYDEIKAMLLLAAGRPLILEEVSSHEFFLHINRRKR